MARADVVLSLTGVHLRYGDHCAVTDLHLDVARGEVLGLLGANGSGKSTTLSACAGLQSPSAGTITLCGLCPCRQPLEYRRRLGYVPQELALYEELTGYDNLSFFGRLYGLGGRELRRRILEALHFVRLADRAKDRVGTYSGGMQRRLNLACALLHRPDLLLLDEPTVGLDITSREAILDCLCLLRERGTAILYTTHHVDEAEALCDRLAILWQGRLVATGSLLDLLAQMDPAGVVALRVPLESDAPEQTRRLLCAKLQEAVRQPAAWDAWTEAHDRPTSPAGTGSRLEQVLRHHGLRGGRAS